MARGWNLCEKSTQIVLMDELSIAVIKKIITLHHNMHFVLDVPDTEIVL